MNNWSFTGNIGKDCESRSTSTGDSVVSFSVAVKSGFGTKAVTTWVRCSMWGKRGEAVMNFLGKGQLVGISGELTMKEFTNKDGQKQSSLEVRVNDLTLLGKRDDASNYTAPKERNQQDDFGRDTNIDDDIPF